MRPLYTFNLPVNGKDMSEEVKKSEEELAAEAAANEELKAAEKAAEEQSEKDAQDQKEKDAEAQELALLKQRADVMGIKYKGNIGLDTLKAKIEAVSDKTDEDEDEDTTEMSQSQLEQNTRDKLQKSKMKLVRCRISNLNPAKNDVQGEIITVANRFVGTVRKFIPFGEQTDGGYHIPQILVDELNTRKFQQIRTKRVKGQLVNESRMVKEFSIEILPPLTEEELSQLADRQQAAQRLEGGE